MSTTAFIKLTSVGSQSEAEQLVRYLKSRHIPAYAQSNFMDIYAGASLSDEDIMIPECDRETACSAIVAFHPIKSGWSRRGPRWRDLSRWQKAAGIALMMIMLIFALLLPLYFIFL